MVRRSREERLEMNRMTARERRRKAKVLIGTLQEQVGDLTRHNEDLRRNNALLRAQLQAVTAQNQNVATISSVGSSSMSTNPAEATGTVASTTATTTATASTSAGSAVSANPSPMAAPSTSTCTTNHNLSDPVTAASLVLRLRQLQQQSQQQSSLASFSSPQINQALATNPAVHVIGSTNFQAQIDQLRMLGLQVPAQMAMQHRPSVIPTTSGIAVPTRTSTISFPTTDLAASALSTYRQQQQQPSQGISSLASAQIDPQILTNNASATAILQNLGLLGGTGALRNAVLGTANANANVVNVNTNALVQLLPALLGQQQQDQQSRMPPIQRPNTQGQPPQK